MLASRVNDYIIKCGFKYGAIAAKAGIPQSTFSAIMRGRRKMLAEEYVAICEALDVSTDKFRAPNA